MSPLLTTRRALWRPALIVLGAAAGIAAVLGLWLGPRSWPFEVAAVAAVVLLLRLGPRARIRRAAPPAPPPHLEKSKIIPGHVQAEYDLARDDSTDSQRWLM
jgi:hypothetical protein